MTDPSFSAIRISLASPDQIRSWSYGEVTKPETINYRNQKPEKDGLFDERIFGPTKDFECYCGKYKRIRYRGVICDRCGVEVTRAKVRRERMGHINLAAPVAHIWFAKGTPSWLAMLLDMTPRNLERVLYYAQFVVIEVDEDRKLELLDQYATEEEKDLDGIRAGWDAQIAEVRERSEQELVQQREIIAAELEARRTVLPLMVGQKAEDAIMVGGRTLVKKGAKITKKIVDSLDDNGETILSDAIDEYHIAVQKEIKALQDESKAAVQKSHKEWDVRRGELEQLLPRKTMTEQEYKNLYEKHGSLFRAGMGAESLLEIIGTMDLEALRESLHIEATGSTGQKAGKAAKRLRVVEGFRKSDNKPEWMVLTVLPVLPPDLRPMVQLDGGRFATSDLNDLYRRVINRNNRLKRLMELGAPDIIVRNEKRMLQEAVDALIDNGRRGRAITGSHNHTLKSLSDMLRGKQGRFRQNLLGKRVDYSGRSVIVVGSTLKLHQCGLPKQMALELFKPFVMHRLVLHGIAPNIKSAKRMVDQKRRGEVWDLLEEVITERPVFLNRAPTLHRLGIQAFEPVLVEGSAIQIHPLVCAAYNADFDGDQMAVHVPIGRRAVEEARKLMLSTHNMLLPSSGDPIVAPTLDIVAGIYYLTSTPGQAQRADNDSVIEKRFITYDDAKLAHDLGQISLREMIRVREGVAVSTDGATRLNLLPRLIMSEDGRTDIVEPNLAEQMPDGWTLEPLTTTIGRILFNQVLPSAVPYRNEIIDKKALKEVVTECYRFEDNDSTALILDALKRLGFHHATQSGLSFALSDLNPPGNKAALLEEAGERADAIERNYQRGLLSEEEKDEKIIELWQGVDSQMRDAINRMMSAAERDAFGVTRDGQQQSEAAATLPDGYSRDIAMMANSGAKGNDAQIKQMVGMQGLKADPRGKILPLPIRSSFRDGLSVLEYFVSTHGARKGLADTALRTADSGYLTRRIIDVAQDVIAHEDDCGTLDGVWIDGEAMDRLLGSLAEHILGRMAAGPIADPGTGEIIVDRNEEIDEDKTSLIQAAGVTRVFVRSPLTCQAAHGMCRFCYGRSLARGRLVEAGEAIGIIAAQSIGEPGTQLTMRTFHTGGDASVTDITSGLPRVEEIFEARVPKAVAPIAEIDGVVSVTEDAAGRRVRVVSEEVITEDYPIPEGYEVSVASGAHVEENASLAAPAATPKPARRSRRKKTDDADTEVAVQDDTPPAAAPLTAKISGEVTVHSDSITVVHRNIDDRTYAISPNVRILVDSGQRIEAGTALAEGPLNPQDVLRIRGKDTAQRYLVDEVQRVYRSQGVVIHDKHIEIIVRQMLRRVRIEQPGDTEFLQGELVDRFLWQSINEKKIAEGGEPSLAAPVLLGVTKVSLSTESFLAAASFQETTRVLTEAALLGKVDRLAGLKENVIIGRLIPAQLGMGAGTDDDLLEAGGVATALADRGDDYYSEELGLGTDRIYEAAFGDDNKDDDWNFDEDDEDNDPHNLDGDALTAETDSPSEG